MEHLYNDYSEQASMVGRSGDIMYNLPTLLRRGSQVYRFLVGMTNSLKTLLVDPLLHLSIK